MSAAVTVDVLGSLGALIFDRRLCRCLLRRGQRTQPPLTLTV
jgi:hypothetical protein